jgi:hemerythrin
MAAENVEFLEAIRREHAELNRQIAVIKPMLAQKSSLAGLSSALAMLLETVERHFEFEERGGYMGEVLRRRPSLQWEVDNLLNQHAVLRADLQRAFRSSGDPREWSDLVALLQQWIATIGRHEARENQLFQEVFDTDNGVGD